MEVAARGPVHAPAVAAAVAVEQIVKGRLVLLILLAHLEPHLPLSHGRNAVGGGAHSDDARVLVDGLAVAARRRAVPLGRVQVGAHAVRRQQHVRRGEVLEALQLAVEHWQRRGRPDAVDVREDDVDPGAQYGEQRVELAPQARRLGGVRAA